MQVFLKDCPKFECFPMSETVNILYTVKKLYTLLLNSEFLNL